jgi:GalNAc5-diNAcBac-PP-undecaprenol beta-1,3-glucosyltransferase
MEAPRLDGGPLHSMPLEATVIIPTHDHGPMLLHSARSALAQTVEEIELFIVGDGVPEVTREIVSELKRDERVRFFDHPKGPRHGEIYRHAALQEARGEIVCYLSDDDLWFPEHVACMRRLLSSADFAHALHLYIDERGEISFYAGDLTVPGYRESLLSGINFVALSCGAHTTEMYRRLPHGWRTTPTGVPTDLYMWQQFLSEPGCRATGGTRPTVLNLPRSLRHDQPPADRLIELEKWSRDLQDPGWRDAFALRVLDRLVRTRAEETMRLNEEIDAHRRLRARLRALIQARQQQIGGLKASLDVRQRLIGELRSSLAEERRRVQDLRRQIQAIQDSRSWRLLTRLGRMKSRILGSSK